MGTVDLYTLTPSISAVLRTSLILALAISYSTIGAIVILYIDLFEKEIFKNGTINPRFVVTNLEKETIILFNEAEDTAEVETFNARLLGQLRKVENCEGVICKESEKGYGVYIVPKTMIKIHAPRQLSEKEKERARNLAKEMTVKRLSMRLEQR